VSCTDLFFLMLFSTVSLYMYQTSGSLPRPPRKLPQRYPGKA